MDSEERRRSETSEAESREAELVCCEALSVRVGREKERERERELE